MLRFKDDGSDQLGSSAPRGGAGSRLDSSFALRRQISAPDARSGRAPDPSFASSGDRPNLTNEFMKKNLLPLSRIGSSWLAFPLALLVAQSLSAAVTFTVTPAAVSNTYTGTITLQVTGLASGDTVVVQKFLDANTNGVIDAADWLAQQFTLTDGQPGMVIGGVTNANVPGDANPTAGQITANLNFPNGDFTQNIVGKGLFKLSSPAGHFTPLTASFSVTNSPYAQKFSGNVLISGTGTAVPNAVVLLFPPPSPGHDGPGGSPLAGTVANNAGSYSISVPPGTYMPVAFKSNYLMNFAATPVLALSSGQTLTTNLAVASPTSTISGKLVDANNSSVGLAGVLVPVQASSGLMGVGFTDSNGNFSVGVQSGQWGINADDTSLTVHGYVGLQDRKGVNAGTTGISLAVPKATALFYGRVTDNRGTPLPGIDVYASDNNNNLYNVDGYSDANGNYCAAVLGGLGANDPWWLEVSSDTSPTNYIFSMPAFDENGGTNISVGQAVLANFTALLVTSQITGRVQDSRGNPIAGVAVWASANINGVDYNPGSVDTDANGNYALGVGNGTWYVGANCSGGNDSLDNLLGVGAYACPDSRQVTINNNNGTADITVQLCNGVQILTTSLPDGQVNSYYDTFLQGSSCSGTLDWSVNDPQDFPPGLSLSGNGEIQGTPSNSGTYHFTVHLADNNGHSADQNLSLNLAPVAVPLQITTTFLPEGTNGAFYSQTLQASGGQTPYSWAIPGYSADPPPHLTLTGDGVLSGTLTTDGGPFYFDVAVTDAGTKTVYQTLSLTIINPPPPPLVITNVSLPGGSVGAAYRAQLGATGGQPPYNWSLALGSAGLPPGLTLDSTGLISGTPTTNRVFSFKVQVTDAVFTTTEQILSITVTPALSLSSPGWVGNEFQMRLNGAAGVNYTVQMSTDLSSTNWTSLFVTNSATANSFMVIDHNATDRQRFYRVMVGP
jgi:hypothetical protein